MDTIKADGFDPSKLRQLAGGGRHHHHHQASGASSSQSGASANQIDVSSLQTLQSILSQYDLNNLTSDQSSQLQSRLSQAGLTQPGTTINLTA